MVEGTIKAKGVQTVGREIGLLLNLNVRSVCSQTRARPGHLHEEAWVARDSRVVVAGRSLVSETGGQKGAWRGESSGSLDEVFEPPDELQPLKSSEHFHASTEEGVGNARGVFRTCSCARLMERCPVYSSDDTQVVVKLRPGKHARTQAEITVSSSFALCLLFSLSSRQEDVRDS